MDVATGTPVGRASIRAKAEIQTKPEIAASEFGKKYLDEHVVLVYNPKKHTIKFGFEYRLKPRM